MRSLRRSDTRPGTLPALLLLCLIGASGLACAQDDEPYPVALTESFGMWEQRGPFDSTDPANSLSTYTWEERSDGDGFPDNWLLTNFGLATVGPGESISSWVALISEEVFWDPTAQIPLPPGTPVIPELIPRRGPIGRIALEIDARMGAGPPSRIFTLGVRQGGPGGPIWAAVDQRFFFGPTFWQGRTLACLEAADFVPLPFGRQEDQPERPPFLESNEPFHFGIVQGQSCSASDDCTAPVDRELGIDNFKVAVQRFAITPATADAWFEVATNGQGLYTAVFPGNDPPAMSFAWFTYALELPPMPPELDIGDASQRWMTGLGPYVDASASFVVLRTVGGRFDDPEPMPTDPPETIGSADFVLESCNDAFFRYEITGVPGVAEPLAGDIDLRRIVERDRCQCP